MNKLTAEWVRKAEADWQAATQLAGQDPQVNDAVCFHCQQTVEKYLKALLQENGLVAPRTHELVKLLPLIVPFHRSFQRFRLRLIRLTEYAVDYRYPGMHASGRQVKSAFKITELLRGERDLSSVSAPAERRSSAMAYYFDDQVEIDAEIRQEWELAERDHRDTIRSPFLQRLIANGLAYG